jgi:hypothetical protein
MTSPTTTAAWRSTPDGDVLVQHGRIVAELRRSTDFPELWISAKPVLPGEHTRLAGRLLVSRRLRLTARDFVGDAA